MSVSELLQIDGARLRRWTDGPTWDGVPAIALGEFAFDSPEAGTAMLRAALRQAGDRPLLGPMDGDTWHAYRAVVESDGRPPFLLEPRSGPHDVAALEAAGFAPIAHYVSTRMALESAQAEPAAVAGIEIQAWDGTGAEPLLEKLFALAGSSFADKSFFKPLGRDEFLGLYRPLIPLLDPRLVLFAKAGEELAGFLLGYRDPGDPGTAVLKTYAAGRRGVGHLLAHAFHQQAEALGCVQVIHALMHQDNLSLQRSGQHGAAPFRRYALFGRRPA